MIKSDSAAWLSGAREIYSFLERSRLQGRYGTYYDVEPGALTDNTDQAVMHPYGLYSGSAGIGLFLLRLYDVTREEGFLNEAVSVAEELLGCVEGASFYRRKIEEAPKSGLKITGWHTGLFCGPAGAGLFLLELAKKHPDPRYPEFAEKLAEDLLSVCRRTEDGLTMTGDLDLFSDGGFVLYLLVLYRATEKAAWLEAARSLADHIFARAQQAPEGGLFWQANRLHLVGMPEGSRYPGFCHGTAGIGWLAACLYEVCKEETYLTTARGAAEYLMAVSQPVGEGRLIPYVLGGAAGPEWAGKYYLSLCHGPAGTGRLFQKLAGLTGEKSYLRFACALADGILAMGAPEKDSWGLWHSFNYCCGTPGILEWACGLYEQTREEKYLDLALRCAKRTLQDASLADGSRFYRAAWDRTAPDRLQTFTGLYIGAAGAGAALLRLHALTHQMELTPMPEELF